MHRTIYFLTFCVVLSLNAIADPLPSYTITTTSISQTMGSAIGGGTYTYGSYVAISATAEHGYKFYCWQDRNTNNPRTVLVESDSNYIAYFEYDTFLIQTTSSNADYGSATGTGNYQYLDYATLQATPHRGYHFMQWSDGNVQNPRRQQVTDNMTYTACFARNSYLVDAQSNNTTYGIVASGGGLYLYGDTATLVAQPAQRYRFTHWSDGCTDATRKIAVDTNITIIAYFAPNGYTITAQSSNESYGSVSGSGVYDLGQQALLTANAATGYHFVQWSDNVTISPRSVLVTSDSTIIAYFAINHYNITALSNNAAQGFVSGTGSYEHNRTVVLTATPSNGYHFSHWSDGNTTNPRQFLATQSLTVTAIFEVDRYAVVGTPSIDSMGTITGSGEYSHGSTATLTAYANEGHIFVKWSNGETANPYRFVVTEPITLQAIFDTLPHAAIQTLQECNIQIYNSGRTAHIKGAAGYEISIYNTLGQTVFHTNSATHHQTAILPHRGIYIMQLHGLKPHPITIP